jgi:hypothetical protein
MFITQGVGGKTYPFIRHLLFSIFSFATDQTASGTMTNEKWELENEK